MYLGEGWLVLNSVCLNHFPSLSNPPPPPTHTLPTASVANEVLVETRLVEASTCSYASAWPLLPTPEISEVRFIVSMSHKINWHSSHLFIRSNVMK